MDDEFLFCSQLLEDVEDTLSCTVFEEDSLSRKLNCKLTVPDFLRHCVII